MEGLRKIPGLPALRWRDMTSTALGANYYIAKGSVIGKADGVTVNTFYELEAPQVDAIRQRWIDDPRGKNHQVVLAGPLSNASTFKNRLFVSNLNNRGTKCLQWLDEQPPRSVVYVSLGSLVRLDAQQMKELALAIEASEQRFLWVIRRGDEKSLQKDFVARSIERGLIVSGWVPQLKILAHSSTGGFITHCGWNSTKASISSGVPMAAWPQFLNCRYVVDVLKIAVEVNPNCIGEEATISTSSSLKKVIHEEIVTAMRLLLSEEGKALRSSSGAEGEGPSNCSRWRSKQKRTQ